MQGWFTVGAGNCEWIGHFQQGWFYYYAEQRASQRQTWEGSDIRLCVRHPGPWERINISGYSCSSDETLRGFTGEFIGDDMGTFTANLQ